MSKTIKTLGLGGLHQTVDNKNVKWNGEQKATYENMRHMYPDVKQLMKGRK